MKKTKVVLASVLKPVDDTRMYEKFGISMSQTNKYDVNIIGFYSKNIPSHPGISFYPIFRFNRLSFKRLFAPVQCLKKLIKLKPEIVIVNTHELQLVAWLYKILFGCKLFYDIRENYYRNIRYTKSFPWLFRPFLAGYVRSIEYLSTLFIDHYFLAEKQYAQEFTFASNNSTVIENKFKPPAYDLPSKAKSTNIDIVFTGTLAESTGVFEAIKLANQLYALDNKIRLKIIGYCAIKSTLKKIKSSIENRDHIQLIGGEELVPHRQILHHIAVANFGFIYYPKNYSTINSIPTKLYEYLGCRLPILLQNHAPWVALANRFNACCVISMDHLNPRELLQTMKEKSFYNKGDQREILWHHEAKKLLEKLA